MFTYCKDMAKVVTEKDCEECEYYEDMECAPVFTDDLYEVLLEGIIHDNTKGSKREVLQGC